MPLWDEFVGQENSIANLHRKAKALSEAVAVGSDTAVKFVATTYEAQVDDEATRRSCVEWLALKLRLIEGVSSSHLRPAQLDVFTEALLEEVVACRYEVDPLAKEQVQQLFANPQKIRCYGSPLKFKLKFWGSDKMQW